MPDENMLFAIQEPVDAPEEASEPQSDKFLIFISDSLLYGLDAAQVVEIITDFSITYLPQVPHFVRGVINLRGQIIPVVDIRLRLGKMMNEECIIIVVNLNGHQIGILVDNVEKMVDIPRKSILPMPSQSSQKLVNGICSLPEVGTILILDCDQMLHDS